MRPPNRPPTDHVSVGSLVRAARERRGWSQRELARRAGLGLRTISRIEREDHRHLVEAGTWQHVATALQVPPLRHRLQPVHALQEALLRDLQEPAPRPTPATTATPALPDVAHLVAQLEDVIATLAIVRDTLATCQTLVDETVRLRAIRDQLLAIIVDRPEE